MAYRETRRRIAPMILPLVLLATSRLLGQDVLVIDEARISAVNDVQVPAPEAGMIMTLHVQEGSSVPRAADVADIDTRLAEIERSVARLQSQIAAVQSGNDVNLRFARKSREVAEAELTRLKQATDQFDRAVSESELDQAQLVAQRAALTAEQAELELQIGQLTAELRQQEDQLAALRLEYRRIRAPLAGTVVEVFSQQGEWVRAGDPLVRIVSLDRLKVEAFVDGHTYGEALVGKEVTVTARVPPNRQEVQRTGTIVFVNPELNPVTGQTRIAAEFDNPEQRLKPGMVAELRIALD